MHTILVILVTLSEMCLMGFLIWLISMVVEFFNMVMDHYQETL